MDTATTADSNLSEITVFRGTCTYYSSQFTTSVHPFFLTIALDESLSFLLYGEEVWSSEVRLLVVYGNYVARCIQYITYPEVS